MPSCNVKFALTTAGCTALILAFTWGRSGLARLTITLVILRLVSPGFHGVAARLNGISICPGCVCSAPRAWGTKAEGEKIIQFCPWVGGFLMWVSYSSGA